MSDLSVASILSLTEQPSTFLLKYLLLSSCIPRKRRQQRHSSYTQNRLTDGHIFFVCLYKCVVVLHIHPIEFMKLRCDNRFYFLFFTSFLLKVHIRFEKIHKNCVKKQTQPNIEIFSSCFVASLMMGAIRKSVIRYCCSATNISQKKWVIFY